ERIRVPVLDRVTGYPVAVLVVAGIATALSVWALPSVDFDYNLLNLQAKGTESVVWERRILANKGHSGASALATATTLDELRHKQKAFEALPSVADVDSVLQIIPDEQQAKIAIVKSFEPLVAPVRIGRSSPVDLDRLRDALTNIKRRLDVVAAEAGDKVPADILTLRQKTAAVLQQPASIDQENAHTAPSRPQS